MTLFPNLKSNAADSDGLNMSEYLLRARHFAATAWNRTSRRLRIAGGVVLFFIIVTWLSYPTIKHGGSASPYVPSELESSFAKHRVKLNETKVGLLIENRPNPILAPLMLHFISVVPPDWRFRFMGSVESVDHINKSMAIREHVAAGKLDLTYIPSNMTTGSSEEISRFLTTRWLYETVLAPAEWLLVFQTDSMLCANSRRTVNDYLGYDWIGAPWDPNGQWGGNGGLSIRRVSSILDVLRHQSREPGSDPEDVWLSMRLAQRPGARMANGIVSGQFSGEMHHHPAGVATLADEETLKKYNSTLEAAAAGEYVKGIDDWRDGFYEPMGYHTGGSGVTLHGPIWGSIEKRKHIWQYCPEVKMTLRMDVAKFVPGQCRHEWKRWESGEGGDMSDVQELIQERDVGYGTEVIDGVEYPRLPPNLRPWM